MCCSHGVLRSVLGFRLDYRGSADPMHSSENGPLLYSIIHRSFTKRSVSGEYDSCNSDRAARITIFGLVERGYHLCVRFDVGNVFVEEEESGVCQGNGFQSEKCLFLKCDTVNLSEQISFYLNIKSILYYFIGFITTGWVVHGFKA